MAGADQPRLGGLPAVAAGLLALMLGAGLWFLWPSGSPDGGGDGRAADGRGGLGIVPATAAPAPTTSTSSDVLAATTSPGTAASAVALRVTAEIGRDQRQPFTYRVLVTVTNAGDIAGAFKSVGLELSGLVNVVTTENANISDQFVAPVHCLVAKTPVSVVPGGSAQFVVSVHTSDVSGGEIRAATINQPPCPV